MENGVVRLPDGYAEAYQAYVEQGWNAIASPEEFGGQGLPFTLSCNVLETLEYQDWHLCFVPSAAKGYDD